MKVRDLAVLSCSLLLLSCQRNVAEREKLFPEDVKLGMTKQQVKARNASDVGTVRTPSGEAMLSIGYASDSTVNSVKLHYPNTERRIGENARAMFGRVSNKAFDHLGSPDDWIQRDTISGQRMVWYYDEDSSVISLEQKRTGELNLELVRSGQRFRDTHYEMNRFLVTPQ
jgi:hypothetical protein